MSAPLQRRLGLYAVFTVSVGAMIGSGIFVLPGLAFEVAGPGVILAYIVAGLVVLPSALAKAEMATAIPRAGGTYLYIDMAMGPMMGTIAGFGVWLSLVFKSAFALDGLGLYLGLFTDVDPLTLGLIIGVVLVGVNLAGIKQSGLVQSVLVTAVFAVLFVFIGGGATFVQSELYHPFLTAGLGGLMSAAALVFVSYAGVTKVASIAEEVSNPARTLPVAIISSLLVMMFVYPAVAYVMVGVTPQDMLSGDLTPLATASGQVFPGWIVTTVAVVGVLALASMANAGLLASSRYPFAMARRRLVPSVFKQVGERSGIPGVSVLLTGGLLIGLVAFLPVFELAKLASAFQLLVFAMINVAYMAFRRSDLWWYRPKFKAPGYPLIPIVGTLACLLLITQLGLDAILAALGIIVVGLILYQSHGRSRALKESAFRESVRQEGMSRVLRLTEEAMADGPRRMAVVSESDETAATPLRVARHLSGAINEEQEIPVMRLDDDLEARIDEYDPDLTIGTPASIDGSSTGYLPEKRDVVLISGVYPDHLEKIAVLGSGGPYDFLKITLATRLAESEGASLRFVHVLDPSAPRSQVRSLERFHDDLKELCGVPTESVVTESEDLITALAEAVTDADLAIVGSTRGHHLFTDLIDRIVDQMSVPVLLIRMGERQGRGSIRRLLDRLLTHRLARGEAGRVKEP